MDVDAITKLASLGTNGILIAFILAREYRAKRQTERPAGGSVPEQLTLIQERLRVIQDEISDLPSRLQEVESTLYGNGHDGDTGVVSKLMAHHRLHHFNNECLTLLRAKHPEMPWPKKPDS